MINIDIVFNERHKLLKLSNYTQQEYNFLVTNFTKEIPNLKFLRKKLKGWSGKYIFIKDNYIPFGLWNSLQKLLKNNNIEFEINGLEQTFYKGSKDEFIEWITEHFKDKAFSPRDYQIDSAWYFVKYKRLRQELSTSAGKTLIMYMTIMFLMDKKIITHPLIVVPNVSLVQQILSDFKEYNNGDLKWLVQMIYSGQEIIEGSNITISTYQSLTKKDKNYFNKFDFGCVDEAHKLKSNSIKTIFDKLDHSFYKIGLSGTFPEEFTLDDFNMSVSTGCILNEITANELMKKGFISQLEIVMLLLDYLDEETKNQLYITTKSKEKKQESFQIEKNIIIQNPKRLEFIVNFLSKTTKNTLVCFHRTKYGELLLETFKKKYPRRTCYYIDGKTDIDVREDIRNRMEKDDDSILFASFGTFATGTNVKKIMNIIAVESFKADTIWTQLIGRGLRLHNDKDMLRFFDIVDDYSIVLENKKGVKRTHQNYMYKHALDRISNIYKKRKYSYKIKKVKL